MSGKSFAVFDIDGTLIRWQLYHALADALGKRGLLDTKAYQVARQARLVWKKRAHQESFRDYEQKLITAFDKSLAGMSVEQFLEASGQVIDEYKDQVYIYTRDLITDLKAKNYLLFAISASPQLIVEKLAKYYGFDDFVGSPYSQRDGYFTGQKQVIFGSKPSILKSLVEKHQAQYTGSLGVGDSEGDVNMLELVEQPIAFNPDASLYAHAKINGWQIVIERKNVVYKLESKNGRYLLA